MGRNLIETVMGAVVLAVAVVFVAFAYSSAGVQTVDGYAVKAAFNRVDGLNVGSDVRLGGIKIGTVSALELDPASFRAQATLAVAEQIELPTDSSARILSEGLLGGSYIDIQPGGELDVLADGGNIQYTQDPINLVDLLGRFVFSVAEEGSQE